ncbi:MAG TPA: type II toxin-antitoxin system VapC family toxin [Acidiphilium sp.]|nr:type II toxin-antitoxin system VapC family toxin [Acidiphilium sp.]
MLLLDTNILSEMMRPEPDRKVVDWIVRQPSVELHTAAVCQAEVLAGLAIMPSGRRRTDLEEAARAMFTNEFGGHILPFDTDAASVYADVFAVRRKIGRPCGTVDLMLAAIARVRGARVVTRNVSDFDGLGVAVVNPWDE